MHGQWIKCGKTPKGFPISVEQVPLRVLSKQSSAEATLDCAFQ